MKNKNVIKLAVLSAAAVLSTAGAVAAIATSTNNVDPVSVKAAAETTKTISTICGFNKISSGSSYFLAISAKEIIGTFGAYYTGTVYDASGNPMTLRLRQNGGASGSWIGEGTRRFEFHTEESEFRTAIGSGNTFYITKDTVFEGDDVNIVFGKEYVCKNIYGEGTSVTEFVPDKASFGIGLVNNRLSATQYRVGVNNMSGIAAGFTDQYVGTAMDKSGNPVKITFRDAAVGSVSGMRLVYIDLEKEVSGHILVIENGTVFTSKTNITKALVLDGGYRINASTPAAYEFELWTTATDYATRNLARITCSADGNGEPAFTHGDWGTMASNFLALSDTEKSLFVPSSGDAAIQAFMERYSYIITKYGTAKYADFIGHGTFGAAFIDKTVSSAGDFAPVFLVAGVSAVSAGFFLIRGRKQHN